MSYNLENTLRLGRTAAVSHSFYHHYRCCFNLSALRSRLGSPGRPYPSVVAILLPSTGVARFVNLPKLNITLPYPCCDVSPLLLLSIAVCFLTELLTTVSSTCCVSPLIFWCRPSPPFFKKCYTLLFRRPAPVSSNCCCCRFVLSTEHKECFALHPTKPSRLITIRNYLRHRNTIVTDFR